MATVCLDHATVSRLGVLFDDVPGLSDEHARLCDFDGLVQTLARSLHYPDRVRVCQRLVANVVCLVQVTVEAAMVQCHVDVENIAIFEHSLVRNAVADYFIRRSANRFGEVAVIQRRGIRLPTLALHLQSKGASRTLRSKQALWTTSSI